MGLVLVFVPVIQTHGLTSVYRVCRNDKGLKSLAGVAYRGVVVPSPIELLIFRCESASLVLEAWIRPEVRR